MANDPNKLKDATNRAKEERPMVVVLAKDYENPEKVKEILKEADLWFLEEA
jgi:hypothetical protein